MMSFHITAGALWLLVLAMDLANPDNKAAILPDVACAIYAFGIAFDFDGKAAREEATR